MLKRISTSALILLCLTTVSPAKISEKTLAGYKSIFMARIIDDNPESEDAIRRFMKGLVLEGNMGIPLLDKFGLFLGTMEKKSVEIEKIRFYSRENVFCLFFIMKDRKDDQRYTLFLEYNYGKGGKCTLKDIYFSIVFEERMNDIKTFFETR